MARRPVTPTARPEDSSSPLPGAPLLELLSRDGSLGLRLHPDTGLPVTLFVRDRGRERSLPLAVTAGLITEGAEVWGEPGAAAPFGYADTVHRSTFRLGAEASWQVLDGSAETYSVPTQVDGWVVIWHYTFRRSHPRLEVTLDVGPLAGGEPRTLRDLRIELRCHLPDLASWLVEAPGNQVRPGLAAAALRDPITISPAGGSRGSAGLALIHRRDDPLALLVWPFSDTEIGAFSLKTLDEICNFILSTGLAGRIRSGELLHYGAIELDLLPRRWTDIRRDIHSWYGTLGLSTPPDRPPWVETAAIFEVQIGSSVFWGGYSYAPYPEVRDLRADLERIKSLGYTVLQIMPRQPYPSYNVHDYRDITISYGDEAELRALVAECHALGIRVILDILLHGVIDGEVMERTAAEVRASPSFARLPESTFPWRAGAAGRDAMSLAWCRHILDFEPHWRRGSPDRHPLVDQHPDWFMRDSAGNVIGRYTRAFDVANVAWHEYFTDAAVDLLRRLDLDGYRFDAPTYNLLPNWSAGTERRASYSALGCLELFRRLRTRLKCVNSSVMLYTEPSGVLFRRSMDVTYNYDEQWLIDAVLNPAADEPGDAPLVRNGREMAAWFRDRNDTLPLGSLIAHHVDSHDTFWWPLPGEKWQREVYGLAAVRALLAVFALSGGAYMTFVGGEQGLEEDIRRINRLRVSLPEIGHGAADYESVRIDHDAIYALVRTNEAHCAVLLVNLSDRPVDAVCSLDLEHLHLDDRQYEIDDALRDGRGEAEPVTREDLRHLRRRFGAFQSCLLLIRPVGSNRIEGEPRQVGSP